VRRLPSPLPRAGDIEVKRLGILLLLPILAACAVGPNYKQPPVTVPDQYRDVQGPPAPGASLADQPWWEVFHDTQLQALIDEALGKGYDVQLAAWRVEEARARATVSRWRVPLHLPGRLELAVRKLAGAELAPALQQADRAPCAGQTRSCDRAAVAGTDDDNLVPVTQTLEGGREKGEHLVPAVERS